MQKHTDAGNLWRKGLARPDGTLAARVTDAEIERDFWKTRAESGLPGRDNYARQVWQALSALCDGQGIHTVLEIGPGWGNYTFPLLERFDSVTAVDISPDNLLLLSRRATEMGRRLNTVCAAWEEADVAPHDLVFAYNCFYRLTEPELFFEKLDAAARKLCVIGMNRPPELPWLKDMVDAGLPVHYTRQGCEEMQEILTSIGIAARRLDIPNTRHYVYPDQTALLRRARSFLLKPATDEALLPLLLPLDTVRSASATRKRYMSAGWKSGKRIPIHVPAAGLGTCTRHQS